MATNLLCKISASASKEVCTTKFGVDTAENAPPKGSRLGILKKTKKERKHERKQKICRNCNNKNTTRWGWRRRRLHEETTEQSVAPWDCRDPSLQIATRRFPFGKNFAVNVKNCGAERRREMKRRCTNG